MSVDTHLSGKNLAPYHRVTRDGSTFLLHPELLKYASRVRLQPQRKMLRNKLVVEVEHEHNAHCRH